MVGKSPLVVSPQMYGVAISNGSQLAGSRFVKTGTGENLLKLLEDGPLRSAIFPVSDLQGAGISSVPVENGFGTQVDTKHNYRNNSE